MFLSNSCKKLLLFQLKSRISTTHYQYLCALQTPYFKFFSNISESKQSPPTHSSLPVTFITDSFGLSPESALRASKEDMKINSMLNLIEREFLRKYVIRYQGKLPDLLQTYKSECKLGCKGGTGDR